MALLMQKSSSLLANRSVAGRSGGRRSSTIAAATGRKSKAAKAGTRKTAKVELDEDTIGTVGAVGIFGAAVATAGFLFVSAPPTPPAVDFQAAPGPEVPEVVAPTPAARSIPLPSADTGTKVTPEDRNAAPKTPKEAPSKAEAAAKPAAPSSPAYKPPAAIKVDKDSVKKSSQGDTAVATPAPKAPRTDLPKFQPAKPAPAVKATAATSATKAASSAAPAATTSEVSPTTLGAVAVLVLGGAAVVANGSEGTAAAAPAAPLPLGAASEASMDERVKDRQAWIAAWRAKK